MFKLNSILNLYFRLKKHSLDSMVLEIAEDLLEKLPQPIKPLPLSARPISAAKSGLSQLSLSDEDMSSSYSNICPVWVFLHNEVVEMNLKVFSLRNSLTDLMRAVKSGSLSEETTSVYETIMQS